MLSGDRSSYQEIGQINKGEKHGARHTLVVDEVDVVEAVRGIFSGKMASVVVECTGTAPA